MSAIRVLMTRAIDYAGLFPPAALGMADAVRNYARYQGGTDAWALGKFVVPLARLKEFEAAAEGLGLERRIPVSVILPGADFDGGALLRGLSFADVVSTEVRLTERSQVREVSSLVAPGIDKYFEIPVSHARMDLLDEISEAGERAKLRTGGVERGSIPAPDDIVNFLSACVTARVAFKASAGLHYALRGPHALTYEEGAPVETMHGFLNLLLAAALLFGGGDQETARKMVEDERAEDFRLKGDALEWCGRTTKTEELRYMREQFAIGFGSCSFEEPLDDLRSLGLL